jgi:hypothetical protein
LGFSQEKSMSSRFIRKMNRTTYANARKHRVRSQRPVLEPLEQRLLLTAAALATSLAWTPTGIGGTGTDYYANMNPLNPSEMYLGSDMGEVWHTVDSGVTWQTLNKSSQLDSTAIKSTVQYTSNVNTAYALDAGGTVKGTTDGGKTWNVLPGFAGQSATHIFADPNSTQRRTPRPMIRTRLGLPAYFGIPPGRISRFIWRPTRGCGSAAT